MECQILFSEKQNKTMRKTIINSSSAELAQRVVKVNRDAYLAQETAKKKKNENKLLNANCEHLDQPAHPRSLLRVFHV